MWCCFLRPPDHFHQIFNQPDVEVFILLGHDTAVLGNQLLTFRGNIIVSSSGVEMSKKNTIEQVDA